MLNILVCVKQVPDDFVEDTAVPMAGMQYRKGARGVLGIGRVTRGGPRSGRHEPLVP